MQGAALPAMRNRATRAIRSEVVNALPIFACTAVAVAAASSRLTHIAEASKVIW